MYWKRTRLFSSVIWAYEMVLMDYDQLSLDDLSTGSALLINQCVIRQSGNVGKELSVVPNRLVRLQCEQMIRLCAQYGPLNAVIVLHIQKICNFMDTDRNDKTLYSTAFVLCQDLSDFTRFLCQFLTYIKTFLLISRLIRLLKLIFRF